MCSIHECPNTKYNEDPRKKNMDRLCIPGKNLTHIGVPETSIDMLTAYLKDMKRL